MPESALVNHILFSYSNVNDPSASIPRIISTLAPISLVRIIVFILLNFYLAKTESLKSQSSCPTNFSNISTMLFQFLQAFSTWSLFVVMPIWFNKIPLPFTVSAMIQKGHLCYPYFYSSKTLIID